MASDTFFPSRPGSDHFSLSDEGRPRHIALLLPVPGEEDHRREYNIWNFIFALRSERRCFARDVRMIGA